MQSPNQWSLAIVLARWLLVCPGTVGHVVARPGTGTGEVADESAWNNTESIDLT